MSKKTRLRNMDFGDLCFVGSSWYGSLDRLFDSGALRVRFKTAFAAILIGIVIATVIMSILSYGVLGVISDK